MEFCLSRAILLASSSLAGLRPARWQVADQLRTCLRQVENLVCDQLASWSQPARKLVADLLARAASELDSA